MSSNLPPGVTTGMIPGNRPEDEYYDKFFDGFEIPSDLMYELAPAELASLLMNHMDALVTASRRGFKQGLAEGKMEAGEAYQAGVEAGQAMSRESS